MDDSSQSIQIKSDAKVPDSADKTVLDETEQRLRIEELELKVRDLKKSDFRKIGTWTGMVAIIAAIMGLIGQGIVYEIKSAKAERQLDSAYAKKNAVQQYADSIVIHLKITRDSINSSKIELQNYQSNNHLAKLTLDSLKSAIAKIFIPQDSKEINQLKRLVKDTKQTLNTQIESSPKVNNNDKTAILNPGNTPSITTEKNILPIVPNDPQKGQWGGLAERNGRKMTATVEELPHHSFKIFITVKSTDPSKPLVGDVVFHLHNTFRNQNPVVEAEDNAATLVLIAVGSFTVGAETDNGSTKLELDLAELPGVSDYFKNQ